MNKRIAFYPGTFDPVTYGHIDIIERSASIFEELVVVVMENPKKKPMFTMEERIELLKLSLPHLNNVSFDMHRGLLVDYAKSRNIKVVVRGLRLISDFDYEFQMALANKQMCPDIEIVFLMTDPRYSFISSTMIKEIASMGGNIEKWVPKVVLEKIMEKLRK